MLPGAKVGVALGCFATHKATRDGAAFPQSEAEGAHVHDALFSVLAPFEDAGWLHQWLPCGKLGVCMRPDEQYYYCGMELIRLVSHGHHGQQVACRPSTHRRRQKHEQADHCRVWSVLAAVWQPDRRERSIRNVIHMQTASILSAMRHLVAALTAASKNTQE